MNYGKVVYGILSGETDVTDLVGTSPSRIYPVTITQGAAFPAIAYTKRVVPADTKGAYKAVDVYTTIYCADNDPDDADNLANVVKDALDGQRNTTIESIQVISTTWTQTDDEVYDDKLNIYMVPVAFKLRINL